MNLFKDEEIQYDLDKSFRLLRYGTRVVDVNPRTLPGSEVYIVDLANFTNLLEEYHHLTDKQVMNISGWIYGNEIQNIYKLTDMVVKAINPNAEGNLGMVNCLKIRLFILSKHLFRSCTLTISWGFIKPNASLIGISSRKTLLFVTSSV